MFVLATCGNGMFSSTGMIPCQPCPRNTYSGPPKIGGYKKCDACPFGTFTPGVGSTGPSMCKGKQGDSNALSAIDTVLLLVPCQPGQYSWTGLQPCSPCPPNFYQPNSGQLRCIECPNDTFTDHSGANSTDSCKPGKSLMFLNVSPHSDFLFQWTVRPSNVRIRANAK